MNYLIDTCIWLDFFEDRYEQKSGKSLAKPASKLFVNIISKSHKIVLPHDIYLEIKKYGHEQDMMLIEMLGKLEIVKPSYSEVIFARTLSVERNLPFSDCLMAIIAKNRKLNLVSRDKHLLINLSDIYRATKPEDIKY